jgi:hypothetical protein
MKRLGFVGLSVLLVVVLSAEASAAPPHKLRSFEARSAAESAAFDLQARRDLDSSTVGRCKRKSLSRFICSATVTGEGSRSETTCRLQIEVRAVYDGYYWTEQASLAKPRCTSEATPFLTYEAALQSIQVEADRFAGQPTRITYLSRRDEVTFGGRAEWSRPRVPANEYIPTENCSVEMVATLTAGAISVTNDGFACY